MSWKLNRRIWLMPVAVGLLFIFLHAIGWPPGDARTYPEETAVVSFVIDGDTVELMNGERVRYIGIDAPETAHAPGEEPDCYGSEATVRNRELVQGKTVRLVREESDRDRYGRLLRHVYSGDVWINEVLVREGFARAVYIRPDIAAYGQLREAQDEARADGAGLWSVCR